MGLFILLDPSLGVDASELKAQIFGINGGEKATFEMGSVNFVFLQPSITATVELQSVKRKKIEVCGVVRNTGHMKGH